MRERPRSKLSDLWWSLPRLSRAGKGRAVGVLSVWIAWDRLLEWFWRPRAVRPGGILRYRRAHHWGRRLTLKDRTVVARGDPVLELHFDTGKDLGVWSIGISTEATYRSVFALADVFLLLGAAFVLRVRETHPARLTAATT